MKNILLALTVFTSFSAACQVKYSPSDSTYILDKSATEALTYYAQKGLIADALTIEVNLLQDQVTQQNEEIMNLSKDLNNMAIDNSLYARNDRLHLDRINTYENKRMVQRKWNVGLSAVIVVLLGIIIVK